MFLCLHFTFIIVQKLSIPNIHRYRSSDAWTGSLVYLKLPLCRSRVLIAEVIPREVGQRGYFSSVTSESLGFDIFQHWMDSRGEGWFQLQGNLI